MSVTCADCSIPLLWNDDAASAICTSCGALADPSQSLLTSSDYSDAHSNISNTLKRFRAGSNWTLAGQSKEARFSKNTYSIHEFINSLALTLSASGLSPRACNLFDQAMLKGQYHWGTKAKLVAGACLSIALRESGRPDSLKDIAFLIDQAPLSLTRTLTSVLTALNLVLPSSELSHYLPALQSHLSSALEQPPESSGLHISLYSELKSLSIQSAAETARSLMELLPCFASDLNLTHSSPGAVASASLILGLEAEKRGSLPHLADISIWFAARWRVSKGTVMLRYKSIQNEISKWIEELYWLDSYRKSGARAKLSKRLLCARGLKDAIHWKDEIWKKRLEAAGRPTLVLDLGDDSSAVKPDATFFESSLATDPLSHPRKKRKVARTLTDAAQFLLDPHYGHNLAPVLPAAPEAILSSSGAKSAPSELDAKCLPSSSVPLKCNTGNSLSSYLLSVSEPVATTRKLPTRLQLLSVARGGADTNAIPDDELFAEGEWDAMQRTPEEMKKLQEYWHREGVLDALEKASQVSEQRLDRLDPPRQGKGRKAGNQAPASGTNRVPKSKRINLDAFARFMNDNSADKVLNIASTELLGLETIEDEDGDEDGDQGSFDLDATLSASGIDGQTAGHDEMILDDWRPPSPGIGGSLEEYYDEEC